MKIDEYSNVVFLGPGDCSLDEGPLLAVFVNVLPERRVFTLAVLFPYSPIANLEIHAMSDSCTHLA